LNNTFKDFLHTDIITYLEPLINENLEFYTNSAFYQILSADDLTYIYDNTEQGYEIIPSIKNIEQYSFMSYYGQSITISELKSIIESDNVSHENFEAAFDILFQSTVDENISDFKTEFSFNDDLYFKSFKYLVISRYLRELNKTI
jgi:hypothetical protein